jgi:transcriptional regulator with XRE-family HTH domain
MATRRMVVNENGDEVPRRRVKSSALTERGIERMGKTLKNKRESMQMTQEEFTHWVEKEGQRLGIVGARLSVGAIQNWEISRIASCPDLGNMRLLAAVFGLDTDSFINYLNGEWASIEEFLKDPANGKSNQQRLNPNLAAEIFREADNKIKAPVIIGELQSLFAQVEELKTKLREIDETDVETFLSSAPKETQKRFYRFLQDQLIGA